MRFVSIHFGQRWPKIRRLEERGRRSRSFNPLRPALAEDTADVVVLEAVNDVSIHFGQRWPKILGKARIMLLPASFNPLRPALAEDTFLGLAPFDIREFQSTSASAGRRYALGGSTNQISTSFNPLRPALAEDTRIGDILSESHDVSIHFGQRWPKILLRLHHCLVIARFQSTSASAGRRYS